jgi:hypothetical protein
MIIGIGADFCDMERIAGAIERRGDCLRTPSGLRRQNGPILPPILPGALQLKRHARKHSGRASPNGLAGMTLRS